METYLKLRRPDQLFVDAMVSIGVGAKAMRQANPDCKRPDVAASKKLKRLEILMAIEERKAEAIVEAGVTQVKILERVAQTMERCAQSAPVLDKFGHPILVEKADGTLAPAYVFDAKGVLKAAELLGQHLKLWTQKHEHGGPGGKPLQPPNIAITFPDGGPGAGASAPAVDDGVEVS